MTKIVIGVDPDSDKHGVAVYIDGVLTRLKSMRLIDLQAVFREYSHLNPVLHIENVCGQNAAFKKGFVKIDSKASTAINRSVGKCQQAQIEVERFAEYYGMEIVRHKISKSWKDTGNGKAQFEKATGWNKQSNEDTRSAAYFGFLGCK